MSFRLNFGKARGIIVSIIFVLVAFSGGYYLGVNGYKARVNSALQVQLDRSVPPNKNVDFSLFWQVWDTLEAKYYDKSKIVPSKMVYGAIEGMVSSLGDPYTMFLPPSQNKIVNQDLSGSFDGVGIELGFKNNNLVVIAPLPDSPAQKAGVKVGDYIIHIKDTKKNLDVSTQGMSLEEAVADIRGDAGTTVTLTLVRQGDSNPITVNLTRATLNVPSVTLNWVGKNSNIADIQISKFDSETDGEWDKVVTQVQQKQGAGGIIIDLRNNPGGYLESAVHVASDFVPEGTTVVIQQNGDGSEQDYKSQELPRLQNYKVVVLINGGSASASEILSGALRDDKGVELVGEKSFGKGTVQDPIDIPGGSGLHVTTAKWLTPKGTWVNGVGLTPDVTVTPKNTDTTDTQFDAALKLFQ